MKTLILIFILISVCTPQTKTCVQTPPPVNPNFFESLTILIENKIRPTLRDHTQDVQAFQTYIKNYKVFCAADSANCSLLSMRNEFANDVLHRDTLVQIGNESLSMLNYDLQQFTNDAITQACKFTFDVCAMNAILSGYDKVICDLGKQT